MLTKQTVRTEEVSVRRRQFSFVLRSAQSARLEGWAEIAQVEQKLSRRKYDLLGAA